MATKLKPHILPKGICTCGHAEGDHQQDHTCFECNQHVDGDGHCEHRGCKCEYYVTACQNCGEEASFALKRVTGSKYNLCSRRCLLQLEYAQTLTEAAA